MHAGGSHRWACRGCAGAGEGEEEREDGETRAASDAARHKECQDITTVGAAVNVALAVAKVRGVTVRVRVTVMRLQLTHRRLLAPQRPLPL